MALPTPVAQDPLLVLHSTVLICVPNHVHTGLGITQEASSLAGRAAASSGSFACGTRGCTTLEGRGCPVQEEFRQLVHDRGFRLLLCWFSLDDVDLSLACGRLACGGGPPQAYISGAWELGPTMYGPLVDVAGAGLSEIDHPAGGVTRCEKLKCGGVERSFRRQMFCFPELWTVVSEMEGSLRTRDKGRVIAY